jgi:hypothetical protein
VITILKIALAITALAAIIGTSYAACKQASEE